MFIVIRRKVGFITLYPSRADLPPLTERYCRMVPSETPDSIGQKKNTGIQINKSNVSLTLLVYFFSSPSRLTKGRKVSSVPPFVVLRRCGPRTSTAASLSLAEELKLITSLAILEMAPRKNGRRCHFGRTRRSVKTDRTNFNAAACLQTVPGVGQPRRKPIRPLYWK